MAFDILKTKQITFTDSEGQSRIIDVHEVEKLESPINTFNILGHVGQENCSGADVGLEFRSVPNKCREKGKTCCDL